MPEFLQQTRGVPGRDPGPVQLVCVTHFFPAHGGGLEKVAEKLVAGLSERGFRICWFSSGTDPSPVFASGMVTTISVGTSNFIERLTQLPYPLWSLRTLPRLWREIGNAQAVHVHEHLYFPSVIAILMARLRRRPVVITQHIGALDLGIRAFTVLYEVGARILGLLIFPLAGQSVFISRNVLQFFWKERSKRARLIFNGVDVNQFTPAPASQRELIRNCLMMPVDRRIVLFVGRFVRKKGLHRVITLAERFPDVHWVLVGSGPERPDNPPPNVRVAGRIGHESLPAYYQAADLLILPSSGEGLPLVVQEALCCGTGILSTDEVASACPEAANMMRARPVPRKHDDLAGWEAALRGLLEDTAYLGEEARMQRARQARTLWSWERCVSLYEEIFHQIVRPG